MTPGILLKSSGKAAALGSSSLISVRAGSVGAEAANVGNEAVFFVN